MFDCSSSRCWDMILTFTFLETIGAQFGWADHFWFFGAHTEVVARIDLMLLVFETVSAKKNWSFGYIILSTS